MIRFFALLVVCASLLLAAASGGAATLPALPQAFIDTTYAPPSGRTILVNAGGDLQAALDNAAPGDTIELQAGATFNGPFTLPAKAGSAWIYIRSSAHSSLPPPGTRVGPADQANMPKIQVAAGAGAAIQTDSRAHHYRFVGIEVKPVSGNFVYALVAIGSGEPSVAALPHDITFDRCYIHGDPGAGGRRGVAMNGVRVAVIDSHVADFKEVGADTQALWTYNTPGPLKIVNNYLEAAGENFMSGGADPEIPGVVPSDIEIRGNHFFKPLSWIGRAWSVKNLLEFKSGQRILVEGNVFENNWASAQSGFAVLITPRNQDGRAPWSVTQDITIRLNKFVNVGQGFNISGRDAPNPSQATRRVLIENNSIQVTRLRGAGGRIFQFLGGPIDTTIRHNTGVITVAGGTAAFSENDPRADQFDFRDNLLSRGEAGFAGTGTGPGTPTLSGHFTNYTFLKNAVIGAPSGSYPADTFFPADNEAVGFVNAAVGDYRLAPSSTLKSAASDGRDVGADIAAIQEATSGAASATPNAPALDYSDLWWNGQESGWGLSITQHPSGQLFAAWYAYGTDGLPLWVVMSGGQWTSATTFTGDLHTTMGPDPTGPFDPARVVVSRVGTGTFTFGTSDTGSLAYTVNGVAGVRAITRQLFGPPDVAATVSYNDLWWNPQESGWGVSINQQNRTLFAVWYSYGADNRPVWYVMSGGAWTSEQTYTGTLYRTSRAPSEYFGNTPFSSAPVSVSPVGSLTFAFHGPDFAVMAYAVNGVSGTKSITRQPF